MAGFQTSRIAFGMSRQNVDMNGHFESSAWLCDCRLSMISAWTNKVIGEEKKRKSKRHVCDTEGPVEPNALPPLSHFSAFFFMPFH